MMTKITLQSIALAILMFAFSDAATAQACNANFSYTQTSGGSIVTFRPLDTTTAIGYQWTFGDGSPMVTSLMPIHTYVAAGSYTVCLKVTTPTDTCTLCTDICVGGVVTTSIGEVGLQDKDIRVYPNPSTDFWNLEIILKSAQNLYIQLTDVTGRTVYTNNLKGKAGKNLTTIARKDIGSGVYLLTISDGKVQIAKKAVKL